MLGFELTVKNIDGNRIGVLRIARLKPTATLTHRGEMGLLHQPCHPLATTTPALLLQFGVNAWTAIQATISLVDGLDGIQQLCVSLLPCAHLALPPRIVATLGDLQHLTLS